MHNIFTWNKTLLIKRLCVMFVEGTIKREKENRIPDSNCKSVELYSYTTFTQSLDSQTDRIIEKENVRDSSTSLERQQLTLPLKDTHCPGAFHNNSKHVSLWRFHLLGIKQHSQLLHPNSKFFLIKIGWRSQYWDTTETAILTSVSIALLLG